MSFVSARADTDRLDILGYLAANAGYAVAQRYNGEFRAVYRRLTEFPEIGSPRPSLGRDTRIVLVHPYVIVYDHVGDTVTVLRGLHGRRNITRGLTRQTER